MRVIRSAGQNVSPSDDGRLFDQAFTDGLFEEATITATGGNTITLSALYGIICGRDFTAEAQTISATLPDSDTATGYVYVEFDTSSEDIITIGTALAPFTPTYEDINTNGAVVQMVIAQYEASAVAVTSVTPTYMTATAGSVKAGSIATVEKSPAVANHSIGEFILYGGDLYEVTAAIAAGETLVVGTNIAAASIGDELSALNNGLMYESTTTTDSYGTVYKCKKYNNGDIEICDVVDITLRGSSEGPYSGMYRSRETRSFPILTRIDTAIAQGTNSNVFISAIQVSSTNTIMYVAQSVNSIATGLIIPSTSVLIRGRWK